MFNYRSHHLLKEFRDVGWEEEKGKKVDFLLVQRLTHLGRLG